MLERGQQLEQELTPEPIFKSVAGAVLLHCALAAGVLSYGLVHSFHTNDWGGSGGSAIQVNLVTSALPLPSDQPPNKNVLATDKPSPAPAAPEPKAKQTAEPDAIPIRGKDARPQPKSVPHVAAKQMKPAPDNRAQYGEQAGSSMPRAVRPGASIGQTSINDSDFGSRFGWYVDGINRKMATSWYKAEVDPRTPRGARVYLTFTINRAGNPSDVQIDRSSGSGTLDRSCQRGVQRVDTFGNLPAAYNQSTLRVSYYCEY